MFDFVTRISMKTKVFSNKNIFLQFTFKSFFLISNISNVNPIRFCNARTSFSHTSIIKFNDHKNRLMLLFQFKSIYNFCAKTTQNGTLLLTVTSKNMLWKQGEYHLREWQNNMRACIKICIHWERICHVRVCTCKLTF